MASPPQVRIFFSSPGDVKMERETARRIVDRIQGEVGDRMVIEPYFWEHEVMVATKDYQENIPEMDGFDIVVCVLWSRLGTPLHPNRHPRPDGGFFESGTEYEFFTAMQAHQLRGTPDIFVFRNTTEPRRPSRPKEAREAVDREVDRLDHFFERYFQEEKYFTGAVNVYSTLGEFEDKLTLALHSFIEGRFPHSAAKGPRRIQYSGLPYLGLSAFDFKDAPVFFGRTAQIGEVVEAYQIQELEAASNDGHGKRFVLILGSSGSGKSSLARAGVLPMLVQPGVIEGSQVWRRVIFKPGDGNGDPFAAFAAALLEPEALPELGSAGTTVTEIATLLKQPGGGSEILLRQAFAQAGGVAKAEEEHRLRENLSQLEAGGREEDVRQLRDKLANLTTPAVRLAVLADQLEELFTTGLSDEVIASFIDRLAALSMSGSVFVLGTLRSDFYPRCLEHPKLVELMRDRGTYALPAPGPNELGQMIRQPAVAAGLVFEENPSNGEKLDELLRDAAIKDPGALPLLSYTLEQLYERRTQEGVMTLAVYHDLGGLEGAIGRRAESIFNELPADAQAAFDPVWRQLVTLSETSEPVRRRTIYQTLVQSPGAVRLVDALVAARLLTIDQATGGERTVSIAHEALLKHWPRVVAWVTENLDFLRARSRMAARLAEWLDHGSTDDYLIPLGPPVAEAEGLLVKHESALYPREIDYVKRSSARARRHEQARLRHARVVAGGALVLSGLAIVGGIFALLQSKTANRERATAVQQKIAAEDATKAALSSQTRAAYLLGNEGLQKGKTAEGLTGLAQALLLDPTHAAARDRLYSYHLYSLPKAIPIRSILGPKKSRQRISGANKGPTQRVVYLTDGKAAEVFDLNTRQIVPGPWEQEPDSFATVISNDGSHLINVRLDISSRIWDLDTGKMSSVLQTSPDFTQLLYSSDGEIFADAMPDGNIRIRQSSDGREIAGWHQEGNVSWFNEIPSLDIYSASGEEVVLYNRKENKVTARRKDPDFYLVEIKCAEEGNIAAVRRVPRDPDKHKSNIQFVDSRTLEPLKDARVAAVDSEIWDYQINRSGSAVGIATSGHAAVIRSAFDEKEDRVFKFETYPTKVCFSPDERLLIASTYDGTVRIFDADTTKLAFEPIVHEGRLEELGISWDGRYLLTSTAERARIWDLAVGPALSLPIVEPKGIWNAALGTKPDQYWISDANGIQEWSLRDLKPVGEPMYQNADLSNCLLDSTGSHAAILWDKKNLWFVHPGQPAKLKEPSWNAPAAIDYWIYSQDGDRLAATVGQTIHFIDTNTGKAVGQPWPLTAIPLDSGFSQHGRYFTVIMPSEGRAGTKNETKLWDTAQSKEIPIAQADASVKMLRNSPDGRWLAASATGVGQVYVNFVVLWDLSDLSKPPRSIPHPDEINNVQFSSDGALLGIGGKDQTVQVWNTETASKAAKPAFESFGTIYNFAFSPDSRLLATIAHEDGKSVVRAWDWKEAVPVSETFQWPSLVNSVAFSRDNRKLIFGRPSEYDAAKKLLQTVEICPPDHFAIDLVQLTEGATGLRASKTGLPVVCDPFESWDKLRRTNPDSWFFQAPAARSVSPEITAQSLRWIEEEAVPMNDLLTSMPAVGLARAAISHWEQMRFNRRYIALQALDEDSEAYAKENAELEKLKKKINVLARFAERNANDDPAVCLHLSQQAQGAEELERAQKFIELALKQSPADPRILSQAAEIYKALANYPKELEALKKLCEINGDPTANRSRLGFSYWQTGDRGAALEQFKLILDKPDLDEASKAMMLGYLDRPQEALEVYKKIAEDGKAASKDQNYTPGGLVFLITGHHAVGHQDEAVDAYTKLIAQIPNAAKMDSVKNSSLPQETKDVLIAVLADTLARHPELAPAAVKP